MDTTRIVRCHEADYPRRGMYTSCTSCELHDTKMRHPVPNDDTKLRTALGGTAFVGKYFGFATLAQFTQWVYKAEWWEALSKEGYVLSVFECQEAYVGYTQAVFVIETATIIKTVAVTDWQQLEPHMTGEHHAFSN